MKKTALTLKLVVLLPFLVITFCLFRFQVLEGEKFQRIAEHNFVRIQRIEPIRGGIFDRNFNPIALNRPSSNLYILPVRLKNLEEVAQFVSSYFPITAEEIKQKVFEQRFRSYQELLLVQNVDYDTVVEISEQLVDYPSLSFRNEYRRSYSYNNHFTGYVNQISREELAGKRDKGYTINSLIGKTGLEKQYEEILRGQVGFRVIQVDATGRSYQMFRHEVSAEAVNGLDIVLTIDSDLQNYIESIFPEDHNGAVIVTDPRTGGILAYVSRPNFNLNIFSETIDRQYWNTLVNDPDSPLLDRITMANYPPASAFKPVVAATALEAGIIKADTKLINCRGSMTYGNRTYNCWQERGHGELNLIEAIQQSCNVYFYALSLELELALMHSFVTDNKLLERTGIDLPVERRGLFPTEQWYRQRNIPRVVIPGHKINLAIGQGEVLFTPLQMVSFYSAIANGGLWREPYLFSRIIGDRDQQQSKKYQHLLPERNHRRLDISETTIDILQEAFYKAVNQTGGTGGMSRVRGVNVYGKTGTGQNPGTKTPNAWFAGYAEWQKPELAFAVIVEKVPEGGGGGRNAAPIAGQIIRYYDENLRSQISYTAGD